MDISRKSRLIRDLIAVCQDSFTSLEKCPKPIVAAVHNHCIGAGVSLITAADIRYASADAIFSIRVSFNNSWIVANKNQFIVARCKLLAVLLASSSISAPKWHAGKDF